MNKIALILMIVITIFVLWIIDFFTLFLVVAVAGYYRYLVVQNNANKLSEFNQTVLTYIEFIGKYAIKAIDALIGVFF